MMIAGKSLMLAGALVLLLTNAIALTGVAYNRKSPPDAVLTLTERELGPQWRWPWGSGENSGLGLRLQLRAEGVHGNGESFGPFFGYFGPVAWLDEAKLAALGFNINALASAADAETYYTRTTLERDVLLVLELDGPTRARALQEARDRSVEQEQSRLFIVDAGLDPARLRQQYPDRAHYAIVRGSVRPFEMRAAGSRKIYGSITAVRCEKITVPLQFRAAVPQAAEMVSPSDAAARRPFIVRMAFGRRFEPWIASARAGAN